jgi:hypothetical protein
MGDLVIWIPLALLLGAVALIARHQMASYSRHVASVQAINDEILATQRRAFDIAKEQTEILTQIRDLLKDGKL